MTLRPFPTESRMRWRREAEKSFRYRALVDGEPFIARLDTDAFGRVLPYEGLWEAEPAASGEGRARPSA